MEKHLSEIYARAQKEVEEKTADFWAGFKKKDDAMKQKVASGKITQDEYDKWRKGQLMSGKHWDEMTKTVAAEMLNANKTATAYINGQLPEIYTLNYNALEDVTSGIKGYSFELADASTVRHLATTDETLLPYKKVNGKKEERWCTQKVNAEVMQGIIQGESIPKIAKRLEKVAGMEQASAIRNARTTTTSAENKGRMDSYHDAEKQGIVLRKRWMATHDPRTREAHIELDGVEVDVDEPFTNELGEIMYPGDPHADPANVYNCRCTLISVVKGFVNPETGKFAELNAVEKEEEKVVEKFHSEKLSAAMGNKYGEFQGLVENSDAKGAFVAFSDECGGITIQKGAGVYRPGSDTVYAGYETSHAGMSEYSTLAHEMNHMFDHHLEGSGIASFGEVDKINQCCRDAGWRGTKDIMARRPSYSDEFLGALREDMAALESHVRDKTIADHLYSTIEGRNATAGVQDALDGFFGTQGTYLLPWGHGERYYNRAYNGKFVGFGLEKPLKKALLDMGLDASNQTKVKKLARHYEAASEAWANVGSAVVCGGAELEAMEKFMPKTVAAYRKIIRGVKK